MDTPISQLAAKQFRRVGVAAGLAIALVIAVALGGWLVYAATNNIFNQTSWIGGESLDNAAHPTNQTGWTKYSSKDTNVDTSTTPGQVSLSLATSSIIDTADADFSAGDLSDNTEVTGSGGVRLKNTITDTFTNKLSDWRVPDQIPDGVGIGGSLVYDGSQYIYGLIGNLTKCFMKYDTATKRWYTLAQIPGKVGVGGDLAYSGSGNYIYALQGDRRTGFYRYSISGDSWETCTSTPTAVGGGGSLVATATYVYALAGNNTTALYRYPVADGASGVWAALTSATATIWHGGDAIYYPTGNCIYVLRGNSEFTFYKYSIANNNWVTLGGTPSTVPTEGTKMVLVSGDIFCFQGGGSREWFKYSISGDFWISAGSPAPYDISSGGDLVYRATDNTIYGWGGK